jgi:hypothetical protein
MAYAEILSLCGTICGALFGCQNLLIVGPPIVLGVLPNLLSAKVDKRSNLLIFGETNVTTRLRSHKDMATKGSLKIYC